MTGDARVTMRWTMLAGMAVGLLATGAAATYFSLRPDAGRPSAADAPRPSSEPARAEAASADARPGMDLPDVVVPLSADAAARAGVTVTAVTAGAAGDAVRVPGVVEADAYKSVVVTPLVSGRVTQVRAELGDAVRRGQTLARVFSPELSEAETLYVSVRAELEAHELELARTEKLVAIGAASQQELERTHAQHATHRAAVQAAASRLELLGLSATAIGALGPGSAIDAVADVPAPLAGVITERAANIGLNVDPSTKLFTVVDLSSVWVVVDVYERDFARVRVGMPATVTTTAYPDLVLDGRVSYIDPQVNMQTRTARARIVVPNSRQELRLGMYAEAAIGGAAPAGPMIPRAAVQHVGERTVVYLIDPSTPERFIEREVHLGGTAGDRVAVSAGVKEGDVVVGEGSFYLRAERERLGLRGGAAPAGHGSHAPPADRGKDE